MKSTDDLVTEALAKGTGPPAGLGPAGSKFWAESIGQVSGPDRLALLEAAAATLDALASLASDTSLAGLREARLQRLSLRGLLKSLRLDAGPESIETTRARRAAQARWGNR
jgi:hypothetical protein